MHLPEPHARDLFSSGRIAYRLFLARHYSRGTTGYADFCGITGLVIVKLNCWLV